MRVLKKIVILIVSAVVLILIGFYFMQHKLIFIPSKLAQDYTYNFSQPFNEIFLETEDGAKLNAIHFKAENPKGIILYFHGNAGDLSRWGEVASYFTLLKYDVLVMDYRTYGKSRGKLTEENLFKDAQLFYDQVLKYFSEDKIIVLGRSLGTTFATYVASRNNPQKLILETPFFNLTYEAKNRFPLLPVKYFLKYRFATNEFITSVQCPVVIFHGTDDDIVSYESGKKLSNLVAKERLTFITITGGEHNNLMGYTAYTNGIKSALE